VAELAHDRRGCRALRLESRPEIRWLLVLIAIAAWPAKADEALWQALQQGGHVLFVRHARTTPGAGDPPGFRLKDCATQRNLSEEGRTQARRMGETFRKRGVPIGEVLSSPWCRCVDVSTSAASLPPIPSRAISLSSSVD
jgi:hypothetical protein